MLNKDPKFQFILNKLKPLILNNNTTAINKIFNEFGLENIISKKFIDHCRIRHEVSTIIFLCSLYLENIDKNDLEILRIREFYQHLQNISSPISSSKLLSTIFEAINSNETAELNSIEASTDEYILGIELAIDFDNPNIATFLVESKFKKLQKNNNFRKIALYLCNRHSALNSTRHKQWEKLIDFHEFILNNIKFKEPKEISSRLAIIIVKLCTLSGNYSRSFNFDKYINGPKDYSSHKFYLSLSACHLNDFPKSIKLLDQLLAETISQDDQFLSEYLYSEKSIDSKIKGKLNTDGISIALRQLNKILTAENINIFLVSGTLLGYARCNGILSHDKDVDVGIFSPNDLQNVIKILEKSDLFHLKIYHHDSANLYAIGLIHKLTKSPIDLFIYYQEDTKLVTGVNHAFGYTQKFAFTSFDLSPVKFLDVPLHVPTNYQLNLKENFGDWELPDKSYISHLESPATVGKGDLTYMIVLRLELIRALKDKNIFKINKILNINNLYKNNFSIDSLTCNKVLSLSSNYKNLIDENQE